MFEIRQIPAFSDWIDGLRDLRAQAKVLTRIRRASLGNLGDVKYFDGIGEMRIDYGPGYRVYFVNRGKEIVILLCGGDKGSQDRDIKQAKKLAKELE
ncbi:type II toxin-antitoxin system RelE/ParE family toxin [Sphingomonas sp. 10B4]|uniref:type II toxin-antitoxin system RelE/ParE family toxin n=1 Tax=Sphingomonas sp. 10B4 TaxID=3048575 RepID=UPI002AB5966F|nr:type II toxin-antitoxin system RelE/ParE family toxin [Sphingomonas sp. 10B4]MDY7525372.1 type II toxin-antitoxin system RelE/ParE family toxin [Sphingomonas sp. 10B4]MEB0284174.1 type II toxin-antitoxin system RelE/ParE family toxin [Sphingomonas sp. 10B4]